MPISADTFSLLYSKALAKQLQLILLGNADPEQLQLFCDDILHHWWADYASKAQQPLTANEHAFWYAMALIETTPLSTLRGNRFLRTRIQACIHTLNEQLPLPSTIKGVRP
ncbi:MAG: hypothetical protein ACRC53_06040 [Plesiomonas sp.]|uniref:hypothetical protein n=1 Tax=Plesiomonas sp. TaxID=2486279 RepID=UPI003F3385E2